MKLTLDFDTNCQSDRAFVRDLLSFRDPYSHIIDNQPKVNIQGGKIDPAELKAIAEEIRREIRKGTAQPPEGLEIDSGPIDDVDDETVVTVHTSTENEKLAAEQVNCSEIVDRVDVVATDKPSAEPAPDISPRTGKPKRKRRTKKEMEEARAKEAAEKAAREAEIDAAAPPVTVSDADVAAYAAQQEPDGASDPAPDEATDAADQTVVVDASNSLSAGPQADLLPAPTNPTAGVEVEATVMKGDETETQTWEAALDTLDKNPPKPAPPVDDPAVELRRIMVKVIGKFGPKGAGMTSKVLEDVAGVTDVTQIDDEKFEEVRTALNGLLSDKPDEAPAASTGDSLDY